MKQTASPDNLVSFETRANEVELSVVIPCLNEAETLAVCVDKARSFFEANNISGEVIVADNGSTDGSQAIARAHGARVVNVAARGYGAALLGGIKAARGRYVIMGDADDSYDFSELDQFINKLREGYDLVMGNRFKGGIKPGAMPVLHRYLGNPVLTRIGRLFFRSPVGDFHCGLRGFKKRAIESLDLRTTGMEFASEMVVKATLHRLSIAEVPTTLSPDGRSRPPHLRTWRDGWRHLRFLLIYSPRWLFLYPGAAMTALGLAAMIYLLPEPRTVAGVTFDIHTMLYASMSIILGLQVVAFALFAKVFAIGNGLLPEDGRIDAALRLFSLENGLILGAVLCLLGGAGTVMAVLEWSSASFGPLSPRSMMRITIPSLTLFVAGVQIMFSSFFLSILGLKHR
ncbi:MAG: glycosyltransferase family 2 protein [Deltaproteobacteria bacterium]|nr:glycosyltransferase family 2 protein [Deltaproteobacteria bacterium]